VTYLAINYARDTGRAHKLDAGTCQVFLALSTYTNANEECWPSVVELVSVTGLSRSTVYRARARLESLGLIVVNRRPGRVCRYWFPCGKLSTTGVTETPARGVTETSTGVSVTPPPCPRDTRNRSGTEHEHSAPRTDDDDDPTPIPAWFARKFSHVLEANT
jgi:DNA-binding transcriptional ArsR family regulator